MNESSIAYGCSDSASSALLSRRFNSTFRLYRIVSVLVANLDATSAK